MRGSRFNSPLRFFWNGIKGSDKRLQRCTYSEGSLMRYPEGTITIYARRCRFSAEVGEQFAVENNSDSMTDYFECDRIRVVPSHPLYDAVRAAMEARRAHYGRTA